MVHAPRLLVVDDQIIHRLFVREVLGRLGWVVDQAGDGAAALAALAAARYALVLLDIQMPGMDGFAVASAVRGGDGANRALPILAYTSLSTDSLGAQLDAAGFDGHIAKPVPADVLAATVAPWWPGQPQPGLQRLEAVFGAAELSRLTRGFRDQLREALVRIDEPDGVDRAHRIAGLAGTLGFAEVHAAWLALSEGDRGRRAEAASIARRVLSGLAEDDEPSPPA